jgi:hypothetical protein
VPIINATASGARYVDFARAFPAALAIDDGAVPFALFISALRCGSVASSAVNVNLAWAIVIPGGNDFHSLPFRPATDPVCIVTLPTGTDNIDPAWAFFGAWGCPGTTVSYSEGNEGRYHDDCHYHYFLGKCWIHVPSPFFF